MSDEDPVPAVWDDMLADLAATAEGYREDGWETLELHPGDVTVLSGKYGDRVGLDVLIPDDEYCALETWFDAGFDVDGYEVYRSVVEGTVFLLVAVRDADDRRAVLFPAYYAPGDGDVRELFARAGRDGELHSYLRRLSGDYVELRHDDPDLFAPPDEGGSPAEEGEPG